MLSVFISKIKIRFPAGSAERWVLSTLYRRPWSFLPALLRSLIATKQLTNNFLPLMVRINPGVRLSVSRHSTSEVVLEGSLLVEPWGNEEHRASVSLAAGAKLELLGDFSIGPGVHVSVSKRASLVLQGRKHSTGSGITCNSRIMVEERVEIGQDCIIAWNVFVSDSDWHNIHGQSRVSPVQIGNGVWIAHDVSILKGARVAEGCIVGAKPLVLAGDYPKSSLICGVPARLMKTNVSWSR